MVLHGGHVLLAFEKFPEFIIQENRIIFFKIIERHCY